MFDKVLIPSNLTQPALIQDGKDSFLIDTGQLDVMDGEWLISIDGKSSIKNLIRLPDNKVKIDYGKLTIDVKLSEILITGKVSAKLLVGE